MHSREFDGREKPKLQMILSYFIQLYQRHRDGTFVDEEIKFSLSESKILGWNGNKISPHYRLFSWRICTRVWMMPKMTIA